MKVDYAEALRQVLVFEGGRVDDPKDPGGRTNRGVTQHNYDAYRRNHRLPVNDVWQISPVEVAAIYREGYADKIWFDQLPAGIDVVVFDGAVNSGPVQSIKWLQRALGGLIVDGNLSNAVLDALNRFKDHDVIVARICAMRLAFMRALMTWKRYGKGWSSRVDQVQRIGQALAMGSVGPEPVYAAGANGRAWFMDAQAAPSPAFADAVAGGGVVATILDTLVNGLTPLANSLPSVGTVVGVLTAVGSTATAAGLAYRWYCTRKAKQLAVALDTMPAKFVPPPPVNDNPAPEPEPDAAPVPEASAGESPPEPTVTDEHHEAAIAAAAAASALAQKDAA